MLIVGIVTSAAGFASEPVPVQSAPTDDSIAVAKQQLDAFQQDANAHNAGLPRSTLPSIALPELSSPAPAAPLISPSTTASPDAANRRDSSNWLVDAMMKPKQPPRRDGDRDSRARGSLGIRDSLLEAKGEQDANAETLTEHKSPRDQDDSAGSSKERKDPLDPLSQYMANWLSPQDSTLLRRAAQISSQTDADGASNNAPVAMLPGDMGATGFALPGLAFDSETAERSAAAPAKPVDNPYLQFLSTPEPPPVNVQPPPPAPAYVPPPPPEQAAPTAPATTPIPDFVKPANDDKYFKPLKRF